MKTGFLLIDPPVNYYFDDIAEVEARIKKLESFPDSDKKRREIERARAALNARRSDEPDKKIESILEEIL